MIDYFRSVHASLDKDGVFFLDSFGGYEQDMTFRSAVLDIFRGVVRTNDFTLTQRLDQALPYTEQGWDAPDAASIERPYGWVVALASLLMMAIAMGANAGVSNLARSGRAASWCGCGRRASNASTTAKIRGIYDLRKYAFVIVDTETGEPCATGATGEVVVRGGCVTTGYWQNDTATAGA